MEVHVERERYRRVTGPLAHGLRRYAAGECEGHPSVSKIVEPGCGRQLRSLQQWLEVTRVEIVRIDRASAWSREDQVARRRRLQPMLSQGRHGLRRYRNGAVTL